MAIRVQSGAAINFGVLIAETVITHGRVTYGANIVVTRPLSTARTIAAGGQAEFAIGEIDLVFPANETENPGLEGILRDAFDGTHPFLVDALTSATDVVTTIGYSQQSESNWTLSQEAD